MAGPWDTPPTQDEIAATRGGGDPWSTPPTAQEMGQSQPEPSGAEAFGRGAIQGGTFGFGDELGGALEAGLLKLRDALPNSVNEALGFGKRYANDTTTAGEVYRDSRDEDRSANKAAEDAHGGLYLAGNIAGSLPTLAVAPGGAVAQGAAYGLGASDADLTTGDPRQYGQALLDTGAGALMGKAGEVVANKVAAPAARYVGQKVGGALEDFAAGRALKAAGFLKSSLRGKSPEEIRQIGKVLMDEGIVSAGDGPEQILAKAEKALAGRGQNIGDALDQVAQPFDASQAMRRMISDVAQPAAKDPALGMFVGPNAGHGATPNAWLHGFIDQVKAGNISFKEANAMKTKLDRLINYRSETPPLQNDILQQLRGILNDEIERQLAGHSPAAAEQLLHNKELYGPLADSVAAAKKGVQGEMGNRFFGLTDNMWGLGAAGAGAAKGGLVAGPVGAAVGAVGGALLNKVARERGPAFAAVVAKKLAQAVQAGGSVGKAAALVAESSPSLGRYGPMLEAALLESPQAFQALHAALEGQDPTYAAMVAGPQR